MAIEISDGVGKYMAFLMLDYHLPNHANDQSH